MVAAVSAEHGLQILKPNSWLGRTLTCSESVFRVSVWREMDVPCFWCFRATARPASTAQISEQLRMYLTRLESDGSITIPS